MADSSVASVAGSVVGSSGQRAGRKVLLPLGLAAFITTLDGTVVSVAAPSIRADLGLTLGALEWVIAVYLLAFGGLLLVGGRLTDLLGRRRVLQAGLLLFGAASVLVALAPGAELLLVGRGLQGVGGALVIPAAFALVASDMEFEDRHLGVLVYTGAIGASIALGPVVGGAIAEFLHWSFIFWLNVPVIAVTFVAVARVVPRQRASTLGRREWLARLDLPGLVLSSIALVSLTFALVEGHSLGYTSAPVLLALLLVVLGGLATVAAERRARFPMLDRELLRHRMVAGSAVGQLLWGLGINGVVFYTSLFLQDVLRLPPIAAGLVFVPLAVTVALTIPFVGRLADGWGSHRVVAVGMVAVAAGLAAVCLVGPGDSVLKIMPGVVLIGVGSAFTTPMSSAPLEVVPISRAGVVSAVFSVAREMAGVLGVALTGAIVAARQAASAPSAAGQLDGFLSGYRIGLLVGAVLALIGAVVTYLTLFPGQRRLTDPLADLADHLTDDDLAVEFDQHLAADLDAELDRHLQPQDRVIDLRDSVHLPDVPLPDVHAPDVHTPDHARGR